MVGRHGNVRIEKSGQGNVQSDWHLLKSTLAIFMPPFKGHVSRCGVHLATWCTALMQKWTPACCTIIVIVVTMEWSKVV